MRITRLLPLLALAVAVGCSGPKVAKPPLPHYTAPSITDLSACGANYPAVERDAANSLTAITQACPTPPVQTRPLNVIAISGAGQYASYAAGLLVGWTARGDRPDFDVVTGISSGALIAVFAYLGPKYDGELQRLFTTLTRREIFTFVPVTAHIARDQSLTSADPLKRLIERTVTDEFLADLCCAHQSGRRLFIGTGNLHTRRLVVWDVGAIACSGRPDSGDLIRKLLLASGSIPGLSPAVPIEVEVNGCKVTELHGDGGGIAQTFVRFGPDMPRHDPTHPTAKWLAGSNLYVIAGGKLYLDVLEGKLGFVSRATGAVSATLYALFRADAWRLFTLCSVSGMRFHMTPLPEDLDVPASSMTFDPAAQRRMFTAGYDLMRCGNPWRATPPGYEPGEEEFPRTGTCFTVP